MIADELERYFQHRADRDAFSGVVLITQGSSQLFAGYLWLRQSLLEDAEPLHDALRHGLGDQALHRFGDPAADRPRITRL